MALLQGRVDPSTASAAKRRKLGHAHPEAPSANDVSSGESSALSSSSEEPSDESSDSDEHGSRSDDEAPGERDGDGIVNLRVNQGPKPVMKLGDSELGDDIRPFLKEFLPKLRAANEELEAQRKAGTLSTVEVQGEDAAAEHGDEQYIEMNLGLGVLERKPSDASDGTGCEDKSDEGEPRERDILGKLMGRERDAAAGIHEVQDEGKEM